MTKQRVTQEQVATSPAGWRSPEPQLDDHAGYHQFRDSDGAHGSFEVFYVIDDGQPRLKVLEEPGWYWWACSPGCLPDGEASGPFPTSRAAFDDAQG